jgi:hypothetical protein
MHYFVCGSPSNNTNNIEDCRTTGAPIPFAFTGALRPSQEPAIAALLPHDTGVLAATTADTVKRMVEWSSADNDHPD